MDSRVAALTLLLLPTVACAPAEVPPPLGAPVGMMVMQMAAGLHVTWQDTFSAETGFELERKAAGGEFELLVGLPANATDHHDAETAPGATYTYRVRAVGGHGPGEWSAEGTGTAAEASTEPPGPPSGLEVGRMHGGLHVWWNDNSTDETGFELQRKSGAGEFATIAVVAADVDNRMDSSVRAGTTYTYRVRALHDPVDSEWSNEASGSP